MKTKVWDDPFAGLLQEIVDGNFQPPAQLPTIAPNPDRTLTNPLGGLGPLTGNGVVDIDGYGTYNPHFGFGVGSSIGNTGPFGDDPDDPENSDDGPGLRLDGDGIESFSGTGRGSYSPDLDGDFAGYLNPYAPGDWNGSDIVPGSDGQYGGRPIVPAASGSEVGAARSSPINESAGSPTILSFDANGQNWGWSGFAGGVIGRVINAIANAVSHPSAPSPEPLPDLPDRPPSVPPPRSAPGDYDYPPSNTALPSPDGADNNGGVAFSYLHSAHATQQTGAGAPSGGDQLEPTALGVVAGTGAVTDLGFRSTFDPTTSGVEGASRPYFSDSVEGGGYDDPDFPRGRQAPFAMAGGQKTGH